MNSNPAANDPIVRIMRDTCARFTDSAENAGVLAPLLLLLAEALARLFGRIEDIFLLWRAGELPPPPVQPLRAPRSRSPANAAIPAHPPPPGASTATQNHSKTRQFRPANLRSFSFD